MIVSSRSHITSHVRSFGPLELTLHLDSQETLHAVELPPSPPESLSPDHLHNALAHLSLYPIPPAKAGNLENWRLALHSIPRAETRTYGEIAAQLHTSPRAVGSFCASNRLLLRIPCHRVVATRSLSGFRAGLAWKQTLLTLEAAFLL